MVLFLYPYEKVACELRRIKHLYFTYGILKGARLYLFLNLLKGFFMLCALEGDGVKGKGARIINKFKHRVLLEDDLPLWDFC